MSRVPLKRSDAIYLWDKNKEKARCAAERRPSATARLLQLRPEQLLFSLLHLPRHSRPVPTSTRHVLVLLADSTAALCLTGTTSCSSVFPRSLCLFVTIAPHSTAHAHLHRPAQDGGGSRAGGLASGSHTNTSPSRTCASLHVILPYSGRVFSSSSLCRVPCPVVHAIRRKLPCGSSLPVLLHCLFLLPVAGLCAAFLQCAVGL